MAQWSHDPRVLGWSPIKGSAQQGACFSLSLCPSPTCVLSSLCSLSNLGVPGWLSGWHLPLAQGMILEFPGSSIALGSSSGTCFSLCLSVSLMNKYMKSLKNKQTGHSKTQKDKNELNCLSSSQDGRPHFLHPDFNVTPSIIKKPHRKGPN